MGRGKTLSGLLTNETSLEINLVWSKASSRAAFEAGSWRVAANTSQHCWGGTACLLPARLVPALTHKRAQAAAAKHLI